MRDGDVHCGAMGDGDVHCGAMRYGDVHRGAMGDGDVHCGAMSYGAYTVGQWEMGRNWRHADRSEGELGELMSSEIKQF
jgi:hypothetical protein